jgi:hypothetical protein
MMSLGMTREQILRYVMGGKPTIQNVSIAKEYLGILNEAEKELQMQQDEESAIEMMKTELHNSEDNVINDDSELFDPDDDFDTLYN